MALGHPFTDAVIHYCGSVAFGGMASNRSISNGRLTGVKGLHANFTVKRTKSTSEGEVVYLDLVPVFVKPDNSVDETASEMALFQKSEPGINDAHLEQDDIQRLYDTALGYVFSKYEGNEIWEEDVFCLNAAVSEFGS